MKHQEIKVGNHKLTREDFASFNDLLAVCESRPVYRSWANHAYRRNRNEKHDGWVGNVSYQTACDLLVKGWDEQTQEILNKVEKINAQGYSKTNRAIVDMVGFSPCVPNAIIGLPKAMYSMKSDVKKSKVIDIVYDGTVAASVDAEELIEKGVQLVAKIQSLELSGYRVKLSLVTSYCHGDDKNWYLMTVPIKNENQPLNIAKVAFPIAHPAMLRVIGFDWYESLPEAEYNGGYGCSIHHWYGSDRDKLMEYFTSANQHYFNYYTNLEDYDFTKRGGK